MKAFWIALSTLTLFPTPVGHWTRADLRRSLFFYPLVGAGVGALVSLNFFWPAPASLRALGALVTWVVLTRAFHLDGLADCLDGWLGGHHPLERRRIMKDPSLGAYGASGLFLLLLAKFVLLQCLMAQPDAWPWTLIIPAAARWAAVMACALHPPRSPYGGLAAPLLGPSVPALASTLWFAPVLLRSPFFLVGILPLALGAAVVLVPLSRRMIGALTGDGLGALIELVETGSLFLAASRGF